MPRPPSEDMARWGRIGADESWAHTEDRTARTAPARRAMLEKFEHAVDPDGKLTPAERAKRAEFARKAHFQRLALKSAKVRKQRREGGAA
jgi:hypothetical protein